MGFGDVGILNIKLIIKMVTELVTEFTGDQTEMINKTIAEAIMGVRMEMIAELTRYWIGD